MDKLTSEQTIALGAVVATINNMNLTAVQKKEMLIAELNNSEIKLTDDELNEIDFDFETEETITAFSGIWGYNYMLCKIGFKQFCK